jgi:HlyD family secretion protein
MKKLLLLLIIAGLGVGGWFYFRNGKDGVIQYQTAPPTRGDVTQAVTATGTLNPVLNVQVGSQISGNIKKLFADFNSEVKEGQVVAQLDPATYQAIVHQIEAELESAKSGLRLAQLTARRQRELTEGKIGTAAALDDAEAALKQAEATVAIRSAQLEKAKVDLGRCTIYAPINGVVISRNVDVGQTVAASMSAPVIFVIANDLRKMQINTNVAEADIGSVEVGQSVEFTVEAFQYRRFRGKVAQVRNAPITVQNVVTYDTIIEVDNEDLKLKPGMTATVSIIIAKKQDVLKVANAALRFRPPETGAPSTPTAPSGGTRTDEGRPSGERRGPPGGRRRSESGSGGGGRRDPSGPVERTIYLLVNGKPEPVRVKLGISDSIHTEVLEGLKENDPVITGTIAQQGETPMGGRSPFGGGGRRPF